MRRRVLSAVLCALLIILPVRAAGERLTVERYNEGSGRYTQVSAQQVALRLDGRSLDLPVPALLMEGRTLVPLRALGEALNAQVSWDGAARRATVAREGITLTFTLGSSTAYVNGRAVALPAGMAAVGVRWRGGFYTMVPLRFVAEQLGAAVEWNAQTLTAEVFKTGLGSFTAPVDPAKYLIAIDPGHGGAQSGAAYGGVMEKTINLSVAKKLRDRLTSLGYRVVMTMEEDKSVGLYERCKIANQAGADLFISLHSNAAVNNSSFEGIYTYYYPTSSQGKALAQAIQTPLCRLTGGIDRGILGEDFVVVRESNMPAVLVEMGFMSSAAELRRLTDPAYQQKLAWGVAEGITRYLNGK